MECDSALVFAADHPAFAGHFPGVPIVPGVLLLDAALHALAAQSGQPVAEIASAKFLHPVAPGAVLSVSTEATGAGRVRFDIAEGARRVAAGQLIMQPAS
jgi:3-hydroxyacyl-[acyl-carrier-protein] dehydratase